MGMKRTASVDFDGVLHDYSDGWTGYEPNGGPIPGAREFVQWLVAQEIEVIISSCRAYTQIGRTGIQDWLLFHGFPRCSVTCEKPHAEWYIDDRGIRFSGDFEAVKLLMERPVWFKTGYEPSFQG